MTSKINVKVRRVLPGDSEPRAVSSFGFISDEIKECGFIVSSDAPQSIPMFVTDEDLEKAANKRREKGRAIDVIADSWGEKHA